MAMSDTGPDMTRPESEGGDENAPREDPPFVGGDRDADADMDDRPAFGEPGFAPAELELGDDDAALPWLEGDDEEPAAGYNTGQVILFVVLGLAALALLIGGIWWATGKKGDADEPDAGGVIAAPDGPYKQRPENPGGKTFEGTGDSSFRVSEGQSQKAQLDQGPGQGGKPAAPAPGFESVGKAAEKAPSGAVGAAADASGVGVQVAAYSTRAQAEAGWSRLSQQYEALSGARYRIVEGQADIGTVYRVQALPGDLKAANALCNKLKASGLNCNVKR